MLIDAKKDLVRDAITELEKKKIIKYMRQYGYYDFWIAVFMILIL